MPPSRPTAAVLLIGDELLSGKIRDANGHFLAQRLRARGIVLREICTVSDDPLHIGAALRRLLADVPLVFTSGGVGPTHDDVTMTGVAEAFGTDLVMHPGLEAMLTEIYGPEANTAARSMAQVPRGADLILEAGPRFPPILVENVVILPGVPGFLRKKFPLIAARFAGVPQVRKEIVVYTDETVIADTLRDFARRYGELRIGSYPFMVKPGEAPTVEVTVTGPDPARVEEVVSALLAVLPHAQPKMPEASDG